MVDPFVGRKAELALLTGVAGRLRETGRAVAVLVTGDPGSGKTRLFAEARARIEGAELLAVAGFEAARDVPLAAAADLLRTFAGAGEDGPQLHSMLFERPQTDSGPELLQIYESAHRCLSKRGRTLVFVDDVQWLDRATMALCLYLLRAASATGQPVGMFAAARPSPVAQSFGRATRQLFVNQDDYREVLLEPLAPAEGLELAQGLRPELSDEEAMQIWDRAGGSPFWLELLVRSRSESHVERVITDRLSGIRIDAASLLTLLVVAARPMPVAEAAFELDWSPDRVDFAANELLSRGVILRSVHILALTHDIVRSAVGKEIPAASARAMHARIALYLEQEQSDDIRALAQALVHRRAGGLATAELALLLAQSPQRRLLGTDVLEQLGAVAEETDRNDALDLAIASLAAELQEHDSALRRYASLHERLSPGPERSEAALGAARAAFAQGRAEGARHWLDEARLSSGDDKVLGIETDIQDALLLRWEGHDPQRAQELSRRALVSARRIVAGAGAEESDRRAAVYLKALNAEFDAAFQSSDVTATEAIAKEMPAVAGDHGEQELKARISVAVLTLEAGRVRDALERFDAALADARRLVLPMAEVEAAFYAGWTRRYLCLFTAARELGRQAKELAGRVGTPTRMSITWVRSLDHLLELSLGEWRKALAGIGAELDAEDDPHYRLLLRYNLAVWTARLARAEEARETVSTQFELGMKDAGVAGCSRCAGEFRLRLAEALLRTNQSAAAAALLDDWDLDHPVAHRQQRLLRDWARALSLSTSDQVAESIEVFQAVAAEAEEAGFVLEALWASVDLGRALVKVEPERAIILLKSLADGAAKLGAANEERLILRELRDLGVRTWRRTAGEHSLSPRELEVARLVVAGASNPEIAEELFLARKTIERHVSNILAKTGARNRTELAGRLPSGLSDASRHDGEGVPR
ncbi:helix-turn-helix transcriptional regulator [soil metagenome]